MSLDYTADQLDAAAAEASELLGDAHTRAEARAIAHLILRAALKAAPETEYVCSQEPHPGAEFYGQGACAECGYRPETTTTTPRENAMSNTQFQPDEAVLVKAVVLHQRRNTTVVEVLDGYDERVRVRVLSSDIQPLPSEASAADAEKWKAVRSDTWIRVSHPDRGTEVFGDADSDDTLLKAITDLEGRVAAMRAALTLRAQERAARTAPAVEDDERYLDVSIVLSDTMVTPPLRELIAAAKSRIADEDARNAEAAS